MFDGWLKLYRKLANDDMWLSEKFTHGQAWVDLLMLANFRDTTTFAGGTIKEFRSGTVYMSIRDLATRWKWSRTKCKDFLENLQKLDMISFESCTKNGTNITILKWKEFQEISEKVPQTGQIKDNSLDKSLDNSKTYHKKYKEYKEEEKEKEKESCVPEGAALQDDAERLTEIPEAYRERFGNDIEAFRRWASS